MNQLDFYTGDSLSTREISGFPLSLPTGLAFESLFRRTMPAYDPNRVIPNEVNVRSYQECWISISTLFRNMVGSIKKEVFHSTTELDFKDALETEIEVINGLFMNEGNGLCKPRFYYCTYDDLREKLPQQVLLREDKTDTQKYMRLKHDKTLKLMMKATDEIFEFKSEIKPANRTTAIILTHHPYDLLSFKNFNKLDLLESNTGRLKGKHLWSTKYYPVGENDMSILPFMRKLLLIFGDRVQIQPSDYKLRKLILETARKYHWTAMTSKEKVLFDLSIEIKEPFVLDFIRKL